MPDEADAQKAALDRARLDDVRLAARTWNIT
jgi:hypothetical protein